eukprot:14947094-Alexandrium_andersonii.AAC.1
MARPLVPLLLTSRRTCAPGGNSDLPRMLNGHLRRPGPTAVVCLLHLDIKPDLPCWVSPVRLASLGIHCWFRASIS